jgi:hypothetical protein
MRIPGVLVKLHVVQIDSGDSIFHELHECEGLLEEGHCCKMLELLLLCVIVKVPAVAIGRQALVMAEGHRT